MVKSTPPADDADKQLEARVDAMMDLKQPLPEIDIFAGQVPSAPVLPHTKAPVTTKPAAAPEPEPVIDEPAIDDVVIKDDRLDTPDSDAAIDDIVAQEADAVLAAEDAGLAAEANAFQEPAVKKGHPIFWFLVVLVAVVAVIAAVILTNPNLSLPFST